MGVSALGSVVSAGGTLMGANAEAQGLESQAAMLNAQRFNQLLAGKYKAQELRQAGNEALASSQREAMDFSRNKDLLLSRARVAAGGGSGDTSVINTMAGIEQQGEFQKAMALYGGENKRRGLNWEADNAILEARNNDLATQYQTGMLGYKANATRSMAPWSAAGTLMSGAGSALNQYRLGYK
jgi:hypothetical protein